MMTTLYLMAAALIAVSRRTGDGFEPPEAEGAGFWGALAVAALALGAICIAAFKSAKRTHLD